MLVNKYADHLPLYRQSGIFERDGIDIDRSTLADWVGKSTALLEPLADAIGRHVLAGQAIFADDTPVKMLVPGTGKTATARLWAYGRDERPWGSDVPPASWYQFSPDRKGQHPKDHLSKYQGWMHAPSRQIAVQSPAGQWTAMPGSKTSTTLVISARWPAWRMSGASSSTSIAPKAQLSPKRQSNATSIFNNLETWLNAQLPSISGKSPLAGAIRYALTRMARLRPYLDHGILELDNSTAERAMRSIAIGRKKYLFVGSQTGGKAAAIAYTLIETAKLNGIDPQAWLADTLARIPDYKINRVDDLLPWKTTP